MLKKQYRLKSKAAFNATYRIKNSFHKEDINTLAGFVVSKKTHKRAVKRNRLKRLMREAYRLLLKSNDLGNSQNYMSLIFIGGEKALDKNFAEVQNIISSLIRRL